ADFDEDWESYGSHETWQGAMRVFIFPESQLLPTLRPNIPPLSAYQTFIKKLRSFDQITPDQARRTAADDYLSNAMKDPAFPAELKQNFVITERMTDSQLAERQALSAHLMGTFAKPHDASTYLQEVFYFVPLLCALQLQRSGEHLAALDWF